MRRQKFRAPRTTKREQSKIPPRLTNDLPNDELIQTWKRKLPFLSRIFSKLPTSNRSAMRMAGRELRLAHQEIMGANDPAKICYRFERVHILTQKSALAHTLIHVLMLIYALYRREWRESLGQIPRIFLAVPSSLFRFAPQGNTGRSTMRFWEKGTVPDDLRATLSTER